MAVELHALIKGPLVDNLFKNKPLLQHGCSMPLASLPPLRYPRALEVNLLTLAPLIESHRRGRKRLFGPSAGP